MTKEKIASKLPEVKELFNGNEDFLKDLIKKTTPGPFAAPPKRNRYLKSAFPTLSI